MTRHTRNRQMVEINRRNPRKKLMLRMEMSSINVTMESVYREPVVWDLDPNFHAVRVYGVKPTSVKPKPYPKMNKRLVDKAKRNKGKDILEQLHEGELYPHVYMNSERYGEWIATHKRTLVTQYYYTFKQPHYTGNGRYFNRLLGTTKRGRRLYGDSALLPQKYKGLFDEDGYRLVVDHGNGTHSKTY
ncbi:hypothetical protein BPS10C_061 [Bacillus phage BPS10C]|uniref:Uncharacterized protein n=1 Tax=Bacillus phage BPS10C TaxID=1277886 RepID=W5QUI0_9CAUD|nr:hypothetical protein BPS10C_061 [Bacillus phage BPS10C]AGI12058.1 hypothetical protein BPS10C_061 [Bacillus phage BPS10C]